EATFFFERQLRDFADANPPIAEMAARFHATAGINFLDLVDHWTLPDTPGLPEQLAAFGMVETTTDEGDRVWKHPGARLPGVRFKSRLTTPRLAIAVESIPDFARANNLHIESCHGDDDSSYQCAHLTLPQGELMPIVRRGYAGFAPGSLNAAEAEQL